MGLIKTLDFKGYEPNYWFIVEVRPNMKTQQTDIALALYKDTATRAADKSAGVFTNKIDRSNYPPEISLVRVDGVGLTYEQMYDAIKENQTNTFFHDAEDELNI